MQPGDVRLEREGDDVGRQAGLDRAALLAGGGVGLVEVEALAGVGLLEGRDDLLVGLARRRVGDERERAAVAAAVGAVAEAPASSPPPQPAAARTSKEMSAARAPREAMRVRCVCHEFGYPTFSTI